MLGYVFIFQALSPTVTNTEENIGVSVHSAHDGRPTNGTWTVEKVTETAATVTDGETKTPVEGLY